jgi:hypothetical protein
MNKQQAKQYVRRLVYGYIEEHFNVRGGHPLVYDEHCEEPLRGRRLSGKDCDRVIEAMEDLQDLMHKGDGDREFNEALDKRIECSRLARDKHPIPWVQADGKPGSRWKGYEQWAKRQGR